MKKTIAFMLTVVLLFSTVASALLITPALAAAPLISESFNTLSEGNGLTYCEAGRFAATLTGNTGWVATNNTNDKFRKPTVSENALNIRGAMRIAKIIGNADSINPNSTIKVNFKAKNTGTAASSPVVFYIAKLSDAANVTWESNSYFCGNVWAFSVSEEYTNKDVTLKVPTNWENTDEPLVFGMYYNPYIGSKEVDTPNVFIDDLTVQEYVEPQHTPAGLLMDGDFEYYQYNLGPLPAINSSVATGGQIWSGATVVKDPQDESNLCATFGWELQQYVPQLKSNTTYYLTYKYKNNSATAETNANFWAFVVELGQREAVGEINKKGYINSSDSDWKLVKREFTTGELEPNKKYAIRYSSPVTSNHVLLDDIGLYEKATAVSLDTTSYRGGSADVSSPYCNVGDSVTFTAKEDGNCTFLGWLENGDPSKPYVSTDMVYTATVTDNLKMVAVFKQKEHNVHSDTFLNPGAETGDLSYWKNRYPEKSAQFTVDSTEKHSGKYSFKLSATETGIYRVQSQRGVLLRPNCEYTVSVWVKTDDRAVARTGLFTGELEDYREGTNDLVFVGKNLRPNTKVTHQVGTVYSLENYYSSSSFNRASKWYPGADDNGWVEVKTTFVTSVIDAGCVLNITLGMQESLGTVWFDDLSVTYKELDFSTQKTNESFCEWNVNRLKVRGFEKPLSATDLNAPQSWQLVKDGTAPEQDTYLIIPAGSGVYVKEMTVKNMRWSVLAAYLKTNKAGTSYIGLTDKQPAQNADFANPNSLGIYTSKPTTSWARTGWKMFANNFTKMWIVIYAGDNDLYLDQLQFFYGDFAHESDPNDTTVPAYDYEGTGVLYDSLDVAYKQAMQEAFGPGSGAPVDYDSENAATGDRENVLPVVLVLLSCLGVCVAALRKGRVTHEK